MSNNPFYFRILVSQTEIVASCLLLTKHRRYYNHHTHKFSLSLSAANSDKQSKTVIMVLVFWEEEEVGVEASAESGEADHVRLQREDSYKVNSNRNGNIISGK